MKFQVQLVLVTQVCLGISFAFIFSLFFFSAVAVRRCCSGGCSGGVQRICGGSAGAGMRSQQSRKVALMRSRSGLGFLLWACCTFSGRVLEGCFCFFFFCFGINPRVETGIQLDVSLWSQER